jgi:hypothetical protein
MYEIVCSRAHTAVQSTDPGDNMPGFRSSVLAATCAALLLAGCGGGDEASGDSTRADDTLASDGSAPAPGLPKSDEQIDIVVDSIAAGLEGSGQKLDKDCLRDMLKDSELMKEFQNPEAAPAAMQQVMRCITQE